MLRCERNYWLYIHSTLRNNVNVQNDDNSDTQGKFSTIRGYARSANYNAVVAEATVTVKGTNIQTMTDSNGTFVISAKEGGTLEFSKDSFETINRNRWGRII